MLTGEYVYILIETFDNVNSDQLCEANLASFGYLFTGNVLMVFDLLKYSQNQFQIDATGVSDADATKWTNYLNLNYNFNNVTRYGQVNLVG